MKKIIASIGITSLLILSACSSDNSGESSNSAESASNENLVDITTVTEGHWIDFDGNKAPNDAYITTENIDISSDNSYTINNGAYVSYYNGDEFIETILQNEPGTVKNVDGADSIKLSFNNQFSEIMTLSQE